MSEIAFFQPLDNFFTTGNYTASPDTPPSYIIRCIRDLSIAEVIPYEKDGKEFLGRLRSVLGLIAPQPNGAYIAGTRTIICPTTNRYIISTEGEARDVLAGRLQYALEGYAGVFEKSASYAVLRIDGYNFYSLLEGITPFPEVLKAQDSYSTFLSFDEDEIILHRKSKDVTFLYLPRSVAPECYRHIARSCLKYGVRLA